MSIPLGAAVWMMLPICLLFFLPSPVQPACDLIVRVKSMTDKPFQAQVTTPDQKKSDKWNFTKKLQRETYQRKGANCSVGQWQVESFDAQGVLKDHEIINLSGVGFVHYEVKDDLQLVQTERQGAGCVGECAALNTAATKKHSPKGSTPLPASTTG